MLRLTLEQKSNNARVVFDHVKITSLKNNLPIRVVTILTILFIQYCIIIGYNNVETKGHKSCRLGSNILGLSSVIIACISNKPLVTLFECAYY